MGIHQWYSGNACMSFSVHALTLFFLTGISLLFIELKQPNLAELCSLRTRINPANTV